MNTTRKKNDHRDNRTVTYAVLGGLIILFGILGSLLYLQNQLSELLKIIENDDQIEEGLNQFLLQIKDAETGQRGYLLTSNKDYLTPYVEAIKKIETTLSQAVLQLENDTVAGAKISDIERISRDKLSELRATINYHDRGYLDSAITLVNTDIGKLKMDTIISLSREIRALRKEDQMNKSEDIVAYIGLSRMVIITSILVLSFILLYVLIKVQPVFRRINKQNSQLSKQQKLLEVKNKELEHFAYITSHDLREPLRTIEGFINVFEEDYKESFDETAKHHLAFIRDAAQRMNKMITSILRFSKLDTSDTFVKVPLNEILPEVLTNLNRLLQESRAVIKFDNLHDIVAKEQLVKTVLQNLIANAIKFRKKDIHPEIVITTQENDDYWIINVSDNGIGIPKNKLESIFSFFTKLHLESKYEGQGIGLATCRKIADIHLGTIRATSELGHGSTFTFTIAKELQDELL